LWKNIVDLTADDSRRAAMTTKALERARPDAARDIARKLLTLVAA
jgi:hypothetical protein